LSVTVPPFDQYQSPLVPLRGLWHAAPVEGDRFVNVDIAWLVTTRNQAVQFSLSGNSPVALSQIVALSVDNSRSGAAIDFVFPDSGFVLTCPARNSGVFPVFTNALMFYAVANGAIAGDETIFQILNSMSPTIMILSSQTQNHANIVGASLVNGTTPIIPAGVNGTLNTLDFTVDPGSAGGGAQLELVDGTGRIVWVASPSETTSDSQRYSVTGLSVRFVNGLNLVVSSSTIAAGLTVGNVYYSTP
jgi:hypothetical protein